MAMDLKSLKIAELAELLKSMGQKKFLADYIFSFIHSKTVSDINDITPLSKALRERLIQSGWHISTAEVIEKLTDDDGTAKYLFEFDDKNCVETVLLNDNGRKTVCISTQIGCCLNCRFCATGQMVFKRNLTAGEILTQVYKIQAENGKINNVVYMGMGEPFLNYDNVISSVEILNHAKGQNIGIRHITLSTAGLADGIDKLAEEKLKPRLAVSLHSPVDSVRSSLMPVNKSWPLKKLIAAVKNYQAQTANRVTFEYVMIADVNDSSADLQKLINLVKDIKCNINLIELNPYPDCPFTPSSHNTIRQFASKLNSCNIETVIRYKRGQNIKAACGQLGYDNINKTVREQSTEQ